MSVSGATRALVVFCNAVGVKPSPFVTEDFVGNWGQCHHCLDHRGWATYPLLWPIRKASFQVCTCLQGTGNRPCLVSDDQTGIDVGGGHKAWLLLRRTTVGAQSVMKTMDLLVGNRTAAVVILGNHLKTAIQRLHIGSLEPGPTLVDMVTTGFGPGGQ